MGTHHLAVALNTRAGENLQFSTDVAVYLGDGTRQALRVTLFTTLLLLLLLLRMIMLMMMMTSMMTVVQLKHIFTGKFVHISTTQTSRRDKNNMLVLTAQLLVAELSVIDFFIPRPLGRALSNDAV